MAELAEREKSLDAWGGLVPFYVWYFLGGCMWDEVAFEYRICEGVLPVCIGKPAVVEGCAYDAHECLIYSFRYTVLLGCIGCGRDVCDSAGL